LRPRPYQEGLKLNLEQSEVETMTVSRGSQIKFWKKWGWDRDCVERSQNLGKVKLRQWPSWKGLQILKNSEVETMTMSRGSQNEILKKDEVETMTVSRGS